MTQPKLVYPGDLSTSWSPFAAMLRDCGGAPGTSCDGVLTREECVEHMEQLERDIYRARCGNEETRGLEMQYHDSERIVAELARARADGIFYLPKSCRDLPENLRRRATEVLALDDLTESGRLDLRAIERARARYRALGERPSGVTLSQVRQALLELDALAEHLGASSMSG